MTEIFQIKATVTNSALKVRGFSYRIIAIDGKANLYKLAEAILDSFDFDIDHAFGFYDNLKDIYRSGEGYEFFADMGEGDRFPGVKKTKVEDVYILLGKKMLFFFDYGDSWRFITQLQTTQESTEIKVKPKVIESVGKAPEQYPDWDDDD